jgi:ribosome-associated protein
LDVFTRPAECDIRDGAPRGILGRARHRSSQIARKPTIDPKAKPPAKRRPPKPAATLAEVAKTPGTPRKKAAAAGPKQPRAPRKPKTEPSALDRVQAIIVESLEADKAEQITVLDLAGRAAFTDRMIIASGLADRQISAMATHLQEKLREAGVGRVPVEGAGGSDWVLIDAGDIVVHLFKPEARELYGLEKMWGEELDEDVTEPVA